MDVMGVRIMRIVYASVPTSLSRGSALSLVFAAKEEVLFGRVREVEIPKPLVLDIQILNFTNRDFIESTNTF